MNFNFARPGGSCQGSLPSQASFIDTRTRTRIRWENTGVMKMRALFSIQVNSLLTSRPTSSGLPIPSLPTLPLPSHSLVSYRLSNSLFPHGNSSERLICPEGSSSGVSCCKDPSLKKWESKFKEREEREKNADEHKRATSLLYFLHGPAQRRPFSTVTQPLVLYAVTIVDCCQCMKKIKAINQDCSHFPRLQAVIL